MMTMKGVCIIVLFDIHNGELMESGAGVRVGGEVLPGLLFSGDIVICARSD